MEKIKHLRGKGEGTFPKIPPAGFGEVTPTVIFDEAGNLLL
ncbi:hypothetical protein GFV12_06550 [Desulfurobacterium thermolithotrophum]